MAGIGKLACGPRRHGASIGLSVADSDPLAGIDFTIRLQTHNGNNVPLGLYQDVACTVPATQDFDPIAAWRDELSGSGFVVSVPFSDRYPFLFFDNGIPTVQFDGIDDYLEVDFGTTVPQPATLFCASERTTPFAGGSTVFQDVIDRYKGGNRMAVIYQNPGTFSMFAGSAVTIGGN